MLLFKAGLLLWLLFAAAGSADAQKRPAAEYQVKAVFLYNFTKFIDWPAASLGGSETPFVIGVLGGNPFGNYLDEVVSDERVNGHPIRIQVFGDAKDIRDVHILYIASGDPDYVKEVVQLLKQKNVLTVCDHPAFVKMGGMVRFYLRENKIKLAINLRAARAAGLEISSRLLKVAEVYDND